MGIKDYVTFIDDRCHYMWIYFLGAKFEVFSTSKILQYDTQFGKSIKMIQSDSGEEFISGEIFTFLSEKGILHRKSFPHTP